MLRLLAPALVALTCAVALPTAAAEQSGAAAPSMAPAAWPSSPFHGVTDGATGKAIPCRCRYQGSAFRLGDTVCMNTHLGVQLARCDLVLNNTSWVPMGVPCTMSNLPRRLAWLR